MKIFASDFDHTLFHRERNPHVSQEDLEAIQAFQGEGNRFGMCTGRPYQGLHLDLPEELHPDFYILSSGACIMDGEGKVLFQKAIPYDVVEQILEDNEQYLENGALHVDGAFLPLPQNTMMLERYPEIGGIQQIEDVREKQIHDISFKVGTLEEAIAKAAEIKERYGDYVDIYPNVNAVDIVPVGCSKGTGLTYVASYYEQTSAEKVVMTCGIGDSINDIPLLETADCSFTFATVPDAVQNQADVIVTSVAAAIQDIKNV